MRKISSILLGAALALTGIGTTHAQTAKTVPYSSPIAINGGFDDGWTVIDANADGETWKSYSQSATSIGGGSYSAQAYGSNRSGTVKDDWLISPAIHLEAGKEYRLFYGLKAESSSHPQDLKVYFTTSNQPDVLKEETPLETYTGYTNATWTKIDKTINCTVTGDYYLSFYCTSVNDNWYMYVGLAQVFENQFTPAGVTNFKAERNTDRSKVECNLSWTLPTTDIFGAALTDEQTVEKVNLYRDGSTTPFKTLTGAQTSYTDTEADGLTAGVHTYEVDVVIAGANSTKASATSKYIGPVTPATLPHTWTPATQDDFDDWKVIKGNNSTTTYNWEYYSYYGVGRFYEALNKVEEDYFVAPPFNVEKAGYYKITVDGYLANSNYNSTNVFKVLYGTDNTEAGLNKVACDKIDFTSSSRTPYSYIVKIDEPGTYYVAVEAASTAPQSTTMYVYGIRMEETEKTPAAVSNLKATPDSDFALEVVLTWDCPTASAAGDALADTEYQTKVYKGDTVLATLNGGVNTYTDSNIEEPGVYTYSVETVAPQGASVGKQTVTTRWVGPHLVALPYTTTFGTSDLTATIWDIVDANNDGKTWHYYSNSYRCAQSDVDGTEPNTRQYNDYFLSPWFQMKPGYYEVKFRALGGTTTAPMTHNVGVVEAGMFVPGRPEVITQNKKFTSTSTNSTSDSYNPLQTYLVKIDQEGTYQIVFAATDDQPTVTGSDLDYSGYGISNFSIAYYPVRPDVATELNVVAADNEELKATVTWKNPTGTNVEGLALDNIVKANVIRDGVVAASLTENVAPGAEMTFVDTKETGLTGGPHTYSVEIYGAEGKSLDPAPTFKLAWVGGGYDIVGSGIVHKVAEFADMWTFIDGDSNKVGTESNTWSVPGSTAMKLDESTEDSFDDWAISPKFNIENGGQYEVRFSAYVSATYSATAPFVFDVYVGNAETPTVDTYTKVGTVTVTNGSSTANSPEYHSVYFKGADVAAAIEEEVETGLVEVPTGTQRIALKATKKGGGYVLAITVKPYVLIEPPYTNNFETASDLDGFNIVATNSTNPDKAWHKGDGNYIELDASTNASAASESNLDTPAIAMEKDKYYVVSFKVWHTLTTATSNFTFSYANNPEFASATADPLKSLTANNMTEDTAVEYKTLVAGDDTGIRYLRVKCISQNGDIVYLTDLNIEEYTPEFPISLATPYLNSFETPIDIYGFEINPTNTWSRNSGGFLLAGTKGTGTITTPAFAMREGRDYRVSYDVWSSNQNNTVTLKYGSDLDGELTATETVAPQTTGNTDQAHALTVENVITGTSDGVMYLVFATDFAGMSNFGIDNLRIEDISPIELPYENPLNTAESLAIFTLDPETGGWFYSVNGNIVLNGQSNAAVTATMTSPAFEVEEGKKYVVKVDASSGNTNSTLKILTGSSLDNLTGGEAVSMTRDPQPVTALVTGTADGVLYFALEGNAFAQSSIQIENLYVGELTYEAPAIPEGAYVVYSNGVVASDLNQYDWWHGAWNANAESPTYEGKAFKFTAADNGANASMGLCANSAEVVGRLHNATLHFDWYAEGTGKYKVQLQGAGKNFFIDLNVATEAPYNTWNTVEVSIPTEFAELSTAWNETTSDGAYPFAVLLVDDSGKEGDAIYFSQIYYTGVDTAWEAPKAPAPETVPVPQQGADFVYSFLSYYGNNVNYNVGQWGQSTVVNNTVKEIDNQPVIAMTNFNYLGLVDFDLDISEYDYMHVDYWTNSENTPFGFVPISGGEGKTTVDTPIWNAETVNANAWNSYDVPLTFWSEADQANKVDLTSIFQIKFVANQNNGATPYGYLANIYFWKESGDPDGVAGIGAEEGEARYFDINGFEVKNPQPGQLLIKVLNGEATKVIVK